MTPVALETLLDYSDHERRRWKGWFEADPARLAIPYQAEGRFPTVASVLDHVFLVERRHLARLQGATPPQSSGVTPHDCAALFEYGDLVRADLRAYVAGLDTQAATRDVTIVAQSGTRTLTPLRLLTHLVLHETRHLAQIALAARLARDAPPGSHDFFYFEGPS